VELLAAAPKRNDEPGADEDRQMFGCTLAGHAEVAAELVQSLAIVFMEPIEERTSAGVGKSFKDGVHQICNYLVAYLSTLRNCLANFFRAPPLFSP